MFQGHTRFATSSIANLSGTHPHQWTPRKFQTYWHEVDGGMRSSTANVEAYITHNGDLDFFEIHGVVYPLSDVQAILIRLLASPMPATVDSMGVAGLIELLRTKGLWKASVRYGYVYGALRDSDNLGALCKGPPTRMWTDARMVEVAAHFEEQWGAMLQRMGKGKAAAKDGVKVRTVWRRTVISAGGDAPHTRRSLWPPAQPVVALGWARDMLTRPPLAHSRS